MSRPVAPRSPRPTSTMSPGHRSRISTSLPDHERVSSVHIDWASLLMVAVVAAATALTVVLLVAFALVGLSARAELPVDGSGRGGTTGTRIGTASAVLCLLAVGLIVCYGVYVIIT